MCISIQSMDMEIDILIYNGGKLLNYSLIDLFFPKMKNFSECMKNFLLFQVETKSSSPL